MPAGYGHIRYAASSEMNKSNAALAISTLALVIAAGPWLGERYSAVRSRVLDDPLRPSFGQLELDGGRYGGALIFLHGFCTIVFEGTAMYEDLEHASRGSRPGIWLDLTQEQFEAHESSTPQECGASGIYQAGPGGHMSVFDGELNYLELFTIYARTSDAA